MTAEIGVDHAQSGDDADREAGFMNARAVMMDRSWKLDMIASMIVVARAGMYVLARSPLPDDLKQIVV